VAQSVPRRPGFGLPIARKKPHMSSQRYSNEEHEHIKVRSIDLDAPPLIDQIDRELLDHLIACRTCSTVFAAQNNSIEEAGCVVGQCIVSQSQVRWQERRLTLALRHVSDETLDEYLFDRLTPEEMEPLEYHSQLCSLCAKKILERETLIGCLKVIFREKLNTVRSSSTPQAVVDVRFPERVLTVCATST
jgi:hypothetical protein